MRGLGHQKPDEKSTQVGCAPRPQDPRDGCANPPPLAFLPRELGATPSGDPVKAVGQDVRAATRSLMKYPVAGAVAVVSLALGIGATTATLTVRNVVFHKPPVLLRSPNDLSKVQVGSADRPIRAAGSPVPGPLFGIWRTEAIGGAMAAAAPSATSGGPIAASPHRSAA